ncbi:DUF6796 family protein [Desulfovibrio sp.]|uniref:DUF6796 family protein n=1 Tax=Desulfovibrio sp. TaxID=885 RepID=UPI003D0D8333
MTMVTPRSRTVFLCLGALGAALMYAGDMLLYWGSGATDLSPLGLAPAMAGVAPERLVLGGYAGPLASLLYAAGFWGIARLLRPGRQILQWLVFLLFCMAMLYGGAYHSHYPHLAFTAANPHTLARTAGYIDLLAMGASVPMACASVLFIYAVLRGFTYCPRAMALLTPLPLFLCAAPLQHLPEPLLLPLAGGWNNLLFIIFFLACARVRNKDGAPGAGHGAPGADATHEAGPGRSLDSLAPGGIGIIQTVSCPADVQERLAALGINPGNAVRMLRPGDNRVVECCGTFVALAEKFAGRITITPTDETL